MVYILILFNRQLECLNWLDRKQSLQSKADIGDGGKFNFMAVLYSMIHAYEIEDGHPLLVQKPSVLQIVFAQDWYQLLTDAQKAVELGTMPEARSNSVLERIFSYHS
jgi:hypothetical protein